MYYMKKIAFLFLIYDVINQEELWNSFFSNIDPNKYSIYIHYKNNTPLNLYRRNETLYKRLCQIQASR